VELRVALAHLVPIQQLVCETMVARAVERLLEHGIQISMAARGNPYENAQAEAFFKTLKSEEVYLKEYRDITDAEQHLERFIEDVYNTKRLHSALGYRPPAEFELLLAKQPWELALVR
jgi:transposase InsO family protein